MPKIPLYTAPVQPSQPTGVRADPGMLAPITQGLSELGAGVRDVGTATAQIGRQLAQAEEFKASTQLDAALQEAKERFVSGLKDRTDTQFWVSEFTPAIMEAVKGVPLAKLAPGARDRINAQVEAFKRVGAAEVAGLAKAKDVQAATQAGNQAVENALAMGDLDKANQTIDQMVSLGLIFPKVAEEQKKALPSRVDQILATHEINTDPLRAEEALKARKGYKNLTEDQRYTLMNRAQEEVRKLQTGTFQGLIDAAAKGEYMTQAELTSLVERKVLKPSDAERYLDVYVRGRKKPLNDAEAADLTVEVMSYDPSKDPNKERYVELMRRIATAGVVQPVMDTLNAEMASRIRATDTVDNSTHSFVSDYADKAFSLGIFGDYYEYETTRRGRVRVLDPVSNKDKISMSAWQQAKLKQADFLARASRYQKANPKATPEEVLKAVGSTLTTHMAAKHSKPLFVQ